MILFKRDGFFHLEYFDPTLNKIRRKSLKTRNKTEALKRLAEFEKVIEQEEQIQDIFLSKFAEEYKVFIRSAYTEKYLSSIEYSFRKFTEFLMGDVLLKDISKRMAENFLFKDFASSKHSAYLFLRTLKAAFNKALTWEYIKINPWKGIKLPKIPQKHPVFITAKELDNIISAIKEQDIKEIVLCAFYSGARLGEILHLQWQSINLELGNLVIQSKGDFMIKNKRDRNIPLHSVIKDLLKNRITDRKGEYVFSKAGILYREEFISKKFKKAVRASGLSDEIHFHTLRHSFASNLVQNGISLYVVKELLGHESISTTQMYSHLNKDSLVNAISSL